MTSGGFIRERLDETMPLQSWTNPLTSSNGVMREDEFKLSAAGSEYFYSLPEREQLGQSVASKLLDGRESKIRAGSIGQHFTLLLSLCGQRKKGSVIKKWNNCTFPESLKQWAYVA